MHMNYFKILKYNPKYFEFFNPLACEESARQSAKNICKLVKETANENCGVVWQY